MARERRIVLGTLLVALLLATGYPAIAAPGVVEHPCLYGKAAARCGVLVVPENRAVSGGRQIDLHYVLLPASGPQEAPIFLIAGGPGQSAIDAAKGGWLFYQQLLQNHDFVILDQRGTGQSGRLDCDLYPNDAATLAEVFPLDAVRACYAGLKDKYDLNAYSSDAAADDINDLRQALHYEKISLFGGSYGSTVALVYIRRHGETVASALLEGVAPPFFRLPLPFPHGAQQALDDLTTACSRDDTCRSAFPNFSQEFAAVMERSRSGIPVDYFDAKSGEHVLGQISRPVLADRLRQAMYSQSTSALVPLVIHRAYRGDTTPLAKLVVALSKTINGSLAMGENFSVDCSEAVAFISDSDIIKASANSFMGDTIIRARQAVCRIWNVQRTEKSFLDPIRSAVPVLMLSGADDPATPPQFGSEELKYLPNGRQVIIPNGTHDEDSQCLKELRIAFLERNSVKNLNAGCAGGNQRAPFATALPNFLK